MNCDHSGKLFIIATPLGNLSDLSIRSEQTLKEVDFWFVEDTRVSSKLQHLLEIKKPMKILNDYTPPDKVHLYLQALEHGQNAALLSDAGTPCISDPGAFLIDQCYEKKIEVDAIPGASAPINALSLSGFFAQKFCFLGFMPRKTGSILKELCEYKDSKLTLVFFESPYRIFKLLQTAYDALGDRRYAICREMTKIHQQVYRNKLPHLPSEKEMPLKGEITLVIEGKRQLG